ncbi:Rhs element Vgr protein [Pseudomonas sp. StFLB209]|uniref:type VI secretion system Vgr family protein n=1 Tax=Pseudomonas sp. StFLB209 TaxID=1028989 RepID=UPI0004F6B9A3|nr:contractile injection system protein, VgrG/Pvc8 family [Pseudomonas sp. StFLB209]BAP44989.1 Rhs element Vgr protein [Pseudomonas sp. StFLB209]
MLNDSACPISLKIPGLPMDFRVAAFSGQEALNEPWRYTIDLISRDPGLELARLHGRPASFIARAGHPAVDGEIIDACQLYAGTCLSHYRISLAPRLQRMTSPPRQRLFSGQSSLQLIERLLSENGYDPTELRLEHLHGVYPARNQCIQYQESDLHLLQRVCEEEGIHFHFDGQQLVFSDDPASFTERLEPLLAHLPSDRSGLLDQLCEFRGLQPVTPTLRQATHGATPSHPQAWQLQQRSRDLERLRCGARQLSGQSRDAALRCGQVIRIARHPEQRYNDHWLVTRVHHYGRQMGVFEGQDPHEIATIVRNLAAADTHDWALNAPLLDLGEHSDPGYGNNFAVIPWTQPFRPALRHPKPRINGLHAATLIDSTANRQASLKIRLDWQTTGSAPVQAQLIPGRLPADQPLLPGSRVRVAYLDGDPDRPTICALLPGSIAAGPLRLSLDGCPIEPGTEQLAVQRGQHLQICATQALSLSGALASIRLGHQGIEVSAARLQLTRRRQQQPLQDLRLVVQGTPLRDCVWYIVHMDKPGLENLSLLDPEHVLFEGRTDDQGYLGMTAEQRRRLAMEYARGAQTLCLLHPGHCVTLHHYLRQSSNDALHQALLDAATAPQTD